MNRYCEDCHDYVETHIEELHEVYPVRGYPIEVDGEVRICNGCGNRLGDIELDDQMLVQGFNKYRKIKNLLMPEEIKSIREQYYGVSQKLFAKVLGLEEKTIRRYECGSLQTESENNLILLMKNPENFMQLVERFRHITNQKD